ncbi:MAG: Mov34/MPN/PAD-1 family protein [Candidatus Woesearchaeota archaeon]
MNIRQRVTDFLGITGQKYSKIIIKEEVISDIIEFARANSPREFSALLEGSIKKDTLEVHGLVYQHFKSAKNTAVMHMNLPMISGVVGSVHSHPSSSTRPSLADYRFFAKTGVVHFIIGYPYNENMLSCYDYEGNPREFTIERPN